MIDRWLEAWNKPYMMRTPADDWAMALPGVILVVGVLVLVLGFVYLKFWIPIWFRRR